MASLRLSSVSKRFGAVHALRAVSFEIAPGEVFGYLGPNGAGKTTTLRAVLGLVHPDTGLIRVLGRPPVDPESRRGVGFLPGELRLWNELTGRAVLDHFARYRPDRPPTHRARVLEALALDDGTLARRVKVLSHGTRQKLGLAIALQHSPELLLLDEPSLGLDPIVQRAFRALVQEFAANGSAILFSSHVLSEVEAVCNRVAVLRAGEIVAVESVATLRSHVVRRLTARFRQDATSELAELRNLTAVERMQADGTAVSLWIRGDINPVLRALAKTDVDELVFPEPQLEDVFMAFYEQHAPDG